MSYDSKIPWTQSTWNFLGGCTEISAGCVNCCARRQAEWLTRMGQNKKYAGLVEDGKWTGEVRFFPKDLEAPLHWRKPRFIFAAFMSDLFHPDAIAKGYTYDAYDVMFDKRCGHHSFQILTKRPDNAIEFLNDNPRFSPPGGWPGIWYGVTVENEESLWRIEQLGKIPAAIRFVSFEPLIGYIPYRQLKSHFQAGGIDQVIIGCERLGRNRAGRHCANEDNWWAAALEIVEAAERFNIPIFFKQGPVLGKVSEYPKEWPPWARRRELPKWTDAAEHAAGLNGQEDKIEP